jgi:DNA-binding transcriptional LysR family regulator
MMQPLWSHRMGLFASPAYLEANGFPRSPDEIRNHAFVGHRLSLSAAALFAKRYDGWAALVGMEASVLASDFIIVTNLIAQGLGIGVAPSVIAATHLASGTLVQVLPALDFGTHLFVLTWPKALQLSGRIRTFVELAAGVAGNEDLD